jgi:rod shape-determining protein MreC
MKQVLYKQRKVQVGFVAIFFLILTFFDVGGMFSPIRSSFWTIISPVVTPINQVSNRIQDTFTVFLSLYAIQDENERLFSEKKQLEAKIARLEMFEQENIMLKKELDLYKESEKELIPARIIGFDNPGSREWIVINKGNTSGIQVGQPVLAHSSILIGRVSEVYPFSSRIELLTSGESVVNIRIVESGSKGVVRGKYGLGLQLDMVLSTESVSSGDRVVTSELGMTFPEGLFIGRLRDPHLDDGGVYQRAFVDQDITLGDLDVVFIMEL